MGGTLMALCFVGIALCTVLGADSTVALVALLLVGGLGYGASFSGTLASLTESVEIRHAPEVSGIFNTTLQIGGTLGVAAFGTLYLTLLRNGSLPTSAFFVTSVALAVLSALAGLMFALANRQHS